MHLLSYLIFKVIADYACYGIADLWTLTVAVIDPFIEAIHWGVTGAIPGLVLARMSPRQA